MIGVLISDTKINITLCYRERDSAISLTFMYLAIAPAIHHKIYIPSEHSQASPVCLFPCRVFVIDSYRSLSQGACTMKNDKKKSTQKKSFHTPYHLKTQ